MLVVEQGQETAIDYRDMAIRYTTTGQLNSLTTNWLECLGEPNRANKAVLRRDLSNELASLTFGNHVAEQEQEGLDGYFVETSDFRDVISSAAVIFTGKKGTGKTANMLEAAAHLRTDARNLVCVVKPVSYELEGLLDVLRRIESRYLEGYLIEALWKYLIYTEIATRAVEEGESRAAGIAAGDDLDRLRKCLDVKHSGVGASFSVRLEKLVESLTREIAGGIGGQSIADARSAIGRALYGPSLGELRSLIGRALSPRERVAVLVDNLDKAWEQGADLDLLSRLLLGLLGTVGRVVDEFQRENSKKSRVNVTLTVFLRSDIYAYIRDRAREPDKIRAVEIEWRDPNLLARVLENRFLAQRPDGTLSEELWSNYFTEQIRGVSTREYLLSCVQARPRNLVFLANSAVSYAANARHVRIDESDIDAAVKAYSQFAYQALLVEGLALAPDLHHILIEFAGEDEIVEMQRLREILHTAGKTDDIVDATVAILRRLGFLGLETTYGSFDYGGTDGEMKRANVLARKHQKATGRSPRFQIHPAYRPYLDIR